MPPARLIASATLAAPSASRSSAATRAPSAPNSCAAARPIPLAAPVTTTTRPATRALALASPGHRRDAELDLSSRAVSAAADVLVAGDVEAVGQLVALAGAEADPRRDAGPGAGGGMPSSTMRSGPRTRSCRRGAVDGERLAEPARARQRDRGRASPCSPALAHRVEPGERRRGAQQHRVRLLARSAHRVHAPVVAVAEVHVQPCRAGRTSSRCAACGRGTRGSRDRRRRGTPRPRRWRRPTTPLPTSTLLSSSGATSSASRS